MECDSKRFIDFKFCYILLSPWTALPRRLILFEIFAYPSNKRVIYGPEMNLKIRILYVRDRLTELSVHALILRRCPMKNGKFFQPCHSTFFSLRLPGIQVVEVSPVFKIPWQNRSSHREVFCKKGILKDLAKFTGKHVCWSRFFY